MNFNYAKAFTVPTYSDHTVSTWLAGPRPSTS